MHIYGDIYICSQLYVCYGRALSTKGLPLPLRPLALHMTNLALPNLLIVVPAALNFRFSTRLEFPPKVFWSVDFLMVCRDALKYCI